MERLTIIVEPMSMTVTDKPVNRSRLYMYAPDFQIFVIGAVPLKKRDAVNHLCFELALERHIPLISLRRP